MVVVNDHPDIRRASDDFFPCSALSIKYSVNNMNGGLLTSREPVITNLEPGKQTGGLF